MYGLGILKGLSVVFQHLVRKPLTRQYPEEAVPIKPRFRGYDFAWVEPRCTACATCAKACPHGCIDIVTHPQEDGRYAIDRFDIDLGKCMVCGLCVEACPYDALFMGRGFELATYERGSLVAHKEDIANRPLLSAYYRPPSMRRAPTATWLATRISPRPAYPNHFPPRSRSNLCPLPLKQILPTRLAFTP